MVHMQDSASATQSQNQVKHGPSFYVIVLSLVLIIHLLSREDQALLDWGYTFFLLHTLLYASNGITWVDVDFYLLARQRSNFDHYTTK